MRVKVKYEISARAGTMRRTGSFNLVQPYFYAILNRDNQWVTN